MSVRILSACRSAVLPRGGAFSPLALQDLAAPVLQAALAHSGIDQRHVDEVIVSNALGAGGNPARMIGLAAGLPNSVAGLSIDRQCAGGLDALLLARQIILSGDADVVVAGGVESFSRRPLRFKTFPDGRDPEAYEQPPFTPWPDRDPDMAVAADLVARDFGIGRDEQDQWAIVSHQKARAATFGRGEVIKIAGATSDAYTRELSPALCARAKTICGTITMANTAVAADGAAFCVLVSERIAAGRGIALVAGATCGDRPDRPGSAPLASIMKALERAGLDPDDLSSIEIMEAYAAQAIACVKGAGFDPDRVNQGGGALARGHPIGASGTINAVRLFHELSKNGGYGLAAIAAAGGIGTALILAA